MQARGRMGVIEGLDVESQSMNTIDNLLIEINLFETGQSDFTTTFNWAMDYIIKNYDVNRESTGKLADLLENNTNDIKEVLNSNYCRKYGVKSAVEFIAKYGEAIRSENHYIPAILNEYTPARIRFPKDEFKKGEVLYLFSNSLFEKEKPSWFKKDNLNLDYIKTEITSKIKNHDQFKNRIMDMMMPSLGDIKHFGEVGSKMYVVFKII